LEYYNENLNNQKPKNKNQMPTKIQKLIFYITVEPTVLFLDRMGTQIIRTVSLPFKSVLYRIENEERQQRINLQKQIADENQQARIEELRSINSKEFYNYLSAKNVSQDSSGRFQSKK
jgi:hypothetical protein